MSLTVAVSVVGGTMLAPPIGDAGAATVGQGFVVTPADLEYILQQIKIAEHHSAALLAAPTPTR